jgi:hypothetical protein
LRRTDFWVQASQGQEDVGGGDERDVVVPALPGASFVVVQAEVGFDFAVVVLDAPAEFGRAD